MEIVKVTPRGYCKGVTRAIAIAKKTALEHPEKQVYVLGMLVHNSYVIKALAKLGIHTIDDKQKNRMELLNEVPDNSIVIFTAHGISEVVKLQAQQRGLQIVDASCPDVVKTQVLVDEKEKSGYEILYIGKQYHPEAESICYKKDHVHLITNETDIEKLPAFPKVFVTNQTTMSIFDVEHLFQKIKEKYPHAEICEEICNATRIRQEAVAKLKNEKIDVAYVVGDKYSNNSNRLAQIAKEQGIANVYRIDDVQDIQPEQFLNAKKIAITSGASTPTYLTNQVITYLENYQTNKEKPAIIIEDVL